MARFCWAAHLQNTPIAVRVTAILGALVVGVLILLTIAFGVGLRALVLQETRSVVYEQADSIASRLAGGESVTAILQSAISMQNELQIVTYTGGAARAVTSDFSLLPDTPVIDIPPSREGQAQVTVAGSAFQVVGVRVPAQGRSAVSQGVIVAAPIDSQLATLRWDVLLVSGVSLIASAFVTVVVYRSVKRSLQPVRQMSADVQAIAGRTQVCDAVVDRHALR
ncbi:hypothetical protein [Trueperella pecoris]|uniref:hypothetical protein n=1 Tax=Trueperella pecoris TaxID=2733571 RepID=UPI001ABDF64A|nr:hypothetical protein [Trueperella pecoris]QTG74871.1 hypothetical protein J4179_06460 [Trueperella pecoris]